MDLSALMLLDVETGKTEIVESDRSETSRSGQP